MTIKPTDIVELPINSIDLDQRQLTQISTHTTNTWQPDRTNDQIAADTQIGKVAEQALDMYLRKHHIGHLTWDTIRQDNFENHTPVDGFLMKATTLNHLDVNSFATQAHAAIEATRFSTKFRNEWEDKGVYGYEIKATRVSSRFLYPDHTLNRARLLRDDFLIYPRVRYGTLADALCTQLLQPCEIALVQAWTPRILLRAYIEAKGANYLVYLVGYIPRNNFFQSTNFKVKNMSQIGKSEKAIYYAVPLSDGWPMNGIIQHLNTL